eukprot:scaffold180870_cov35-Tisochrysis_lutea.AAC.2
MGEKQKRGPPKALHRSTAQERTQGGADPDGMQGARPGDTTSAEAEAVESRFILSCGHLHLLSA